MSAGERVKAVRKDAGLTLDEFGARIGLKNAALSLIENNKRALTDTVAKSIAREFGVSEEWLKTGEGEMRPATVSGAAAEIAARLKLGPWAAQALESFMALGEKDQDLFLEILEKILDPIEAQPDVLDDDSEALIRAAGEEAMARKRAELLDEKREQDA